MKFSAVLDKVIGLSSKVYDYYSTELPKWHPNYPLENPGEETAPPPPEEGQLRKFLETLSEETIEQLMLLLHVGRHQINADRLVEEYEHSKSLYAGKDDAIAEMMFTAPLASYLMGGREELLKHKMNVDKIALAKVKAKR